MQELLVSSLAQTDALAKLLIEKGLISREEFMQKITEERANVSEAFDANDKKKRVVLGPRISVGCISNEALDHNGLSFGAGLVIALAVIFGAYSWYKSRPGSWDNKSITASYDKRDH